MKKLMVIAGGLLCIAGLYLLLILAAPHVALNHAPATLNDAAKYDSVSIGSIGLYAPIVSGGSEALNKGAWHRFAERGNPSQGGTFILSAHSFVFRWNPLQTRQDSYFFNLHKATPGTKVDVVWKGKPYTYQVTRVYQVKPDATEIEQVTSEDHLVLYTCTPGGSADGRVVVEARPQEGD